MVNAETKWSACRFTGNSADLTVGRDWSCDSISMEAVSGAKPRHVAARATLGEPCCRRTEVLHEAAHKAETRENGTGWKTHEREDGTPAIDAMWPSPGTATRDRTSRKTRKTGEGHVRAPENNSGKQERHRDADRWLWLGGGREFVWARENPGQRDGERPSAEQRTSLRGST
ncbi:hypothetical protein ERJ75_000515700 [Trypanosoma vivax]|nr:hypothetical protein TRVL_07095 [Trypanosoma vivax]KAH8616097.1 hypothetical protein ERJ75_000515700 [Trypanosoma vivax]